MLIVGPTGTGKELLARHVHHWSGRRGGLVDVNCAGFPRELADGWLFGHRAHAFTGAGEAAPGLIEAARNGTLFLDEICSLPLEMQAKLLRVLETGEVRRVMDTAKRRVEFGVIAAAQESITSALTAGEFRADLYQRLAGTVIALPPLVERPEDVLPLARHFAALRGRALDDGVSLVLDHYGWPGNVRELSATLHRAACLDSRPTISAAALAEAIALGAPSFHPAVTPIGDSTTLNPIHEGPYRALAERQRLAAVLEAARWDTIAAAEELGIHRATLYRQMRRHGLKRPALLRGPEGANSPTRANASR